MQGRFPAHTAVILACYAARMPIVPVAPPQHVPVYSGFDYVTVDAAHRRVYAAHTGSRALLVVDADTGAIVGQVRVGPMHGVAYDPETGHVFTGNGDDKTVSESDPQTLKVLRSVDVDGAIDAIAYDATLGRIYADEDDGTRIFVIDAKTFKVLKTITIPGHKPEYLAVDPQTHQVYQNITDLSEIAVIDPQSLAVAKTLPTPELANTNHPLQYDAGLHEIVAGGSNGVLGIYDRDGNKKFQIEVPKRIDQCDLDASVHMLACAGSGGITVVKLDATSGPKIVGQISVAPGIHTLAIDAKTHNIWAVWGAQDGSGDFVQRFSLTP
jgi:glutamine cyclotransferase